MTPLGSNDPRRIGPYRLVAELGRGGMGRVLLGSAPDGRLVALKQVRAQFTDDDGFRARFRREVDVSRRVPGAYTAAVVDADPDGATPWLASVFVPGPSLREVLAATGALPLEPVTRLAAGLAAALAEIHQAGLVHRDLKPSNVLLTGEGLRVIDFGIARAIEAQGGTEVTHTGWLVGSPGFMSPEQAEGGPVTPASDMFSLGAVLVMASTGRSPFAGASTPQILYNVVFAEPELDAVPERIRGLVARCLAKNPDGRPTPAEMLESLGTTGPADQPWPPAVHDMIAAQRAEVTRLLAAADMRDRLLGTLATLLGASLRQRTLTGQRPAVTELAGQPLFTPAGPPPTMPAEPPTVVTASPTAEPPTVVTGPSPTAEPPIVVTGPPPLPEQSPVAPMPPIGGGAPGSWPAAPYGMPPGPFVPPPRKSHTGAIIGIVAGALALVLAAFAVVGVVAYRSFDRSGSPSAGSHHSQTPQYSPSPTYSPSPSPSPTARDPYTLDNSTTDETPLEADQFFLNPVSSYELVASGPYSACSDAGGDATESLLRAHGCGSMVTADYLDTADELLASVMVIPLTSSTDASAVKSELVTDSKNMTSTWTELSYFCPHSGTGSDLCDAGRYPVWRGLFNAYHRYFVMVTVLRLDGGETPATSAVGSLTNTLLDSVADQMLVIR